ncbi:Hamartin protein-domain-containing protein [Microdochium trichocladiopsis]|uniref:Hamartin protein-domain-containing protein n=1 Tax=Microdochium trichocladiopsis TaxID=1682393 RepID=A0A9P8Y6Y3_9PEZI|nr:Hamartin protein-domain-containing protein [Microdochium trichocladiopsis]KAH7031092.1 Hamartin protein-domain-containing protein [Microdochium trichocladiopsis]
MSSLPQFKDLTKAVQAYVPTGTLPLSDDLADIIEGYVRKHEDKFEESIADKVNEELLSIFHNAVANNPPRYAPFMAVLRRLRPLISQPDKVLKWTDLLMPILDHLTQEKDLASESQALVLEILTAEDEHKGAGPVGGVPMAMAEKLLCIWLEECKCAGRSDEASQSFKERHIRETLLQYGRKRPKDLMIVMDKYFVRMTCRARILLLVADFVKSQPPHLYTILQTPLFGNLLTCLQQDTSSTIISLALGVLTMVLPHIPSSLVPYLPTLFNIYARLLFWDRQLSHEATSADSTQDPRISPSSSTWDKCGFSSNLDVTSIQHLMSFYTILYGLYPINFTDYIRKPQRYLRHADVPEADDVEVQPTEIRHATEPFRQCHLLHENFYTLTIESEKTDFGRWIKSEPAEVVADCMALYVAPEWQPEIIAPNFTVEAPGVGAVDVGDEPEATLLGGLSPQRTSVSSSTQAESLKPAVSPDIESNAEADALPPIARKSSQASHHSVKDSSAMATSSDGLETLPRQLTTSGSQTRLQDMINSNKAIKSGLHQSLNNDSVPSLALSQHESISERLHSHLNPGAAPAGTATDQKGCRESSTGHLYRQILLLQNDLTFERFMKQQHLTHMGELRRRQLREATTEAEAQNLMITNRHLKQRLAEAKSTEIQVKKEAEKSRTMSKKWEADLTTKLRALREEQKKWTAREKSLVSELDAAKSEHAKLVQLLCDAEVRELGLKQNMQSVELHVAELERLRKEVERLTEAERNFQAREAERQAALTSAEEADGRAEASRMKVAALEQELRQNQQRHQAEISALNTRLQDTLKKGSEPQIEDLRPKLKAAIAGARAQQELFRERLVEFAKRNNALQTELLELRSSLPTRRRSDPLHAYDKRRSKDASSESEDIPHTRTQRGLSDPETYDPTSYNATAPLEPVKSSGSDGRDGGPLIDAAPERAETGAAERYIGRGGVQNFRKEKKDKKDDRDRRKLVGIRGIRGLCRG